MTQILIVAFGAIGLGFALIFLLALADRQAKKKGPPAAETGLSQGDFEKACVEVVERMKLEVLEIVRNEDDDLEIRARNPAPIVGGDFFVVTFYLPPPEVVSAAEIIEVSNVIVQDRLSKGILMTNTRFTDDLPAIGELAPLEFIDGEKLKSMKSNLPMV